jgi:hypothetical protein
LFAVSGKILEISSGASILIVSSFLIGVIGVGGQLHYVILIGKFPKWPKTEP